MLRCGRLDKQNQALCLGRKTDLSPALGEELCCKRGSSEWTGVQPGIPPYASQIAPFPTCRATLSLHLTHTTVVDSSVAPVLTHDPGVL